MARLTLLLPNLGNGGAERVALMLAEEFLAHGHEVDLVLVQAKGELLGHIPTGVQLFDLRATRFRTALRPLIRYLRERRPFALQVSMWPLTIIAILAARLSGVNPRVIVSDHSTLSKQYGASWSTMAALKWTTRLLYPLAVARVCASTGSAVDLANISGLRPEQFTTIHNPVLRPPPELSSNPAVERLWNSSERRILTVGMMKEAKNHELLIRAFAHVRKDLSAKLMILGEGSLRPTLERLIAELELGEDVILAGFASDPWPYYASADLFVLSSNREGFPGVLVEAMLAGLPIVSTDCESGPREILDGGRLGRLVPVGDAEALAKAIAAALNEQHDPGPGREQISRLSGSSSKQYLDLMLGDAHVDSGSK